MKEFLFDGWGILLLLLAISPPLLAFRFSFFWKFLRWFARQWRNTR